MSLDQKNFLIQLINALTPEDQHKWIQQMNNFCDEVGQRGTRKSARVDIVEEIMTKIISARDVPPIAIASPVHSSPIETSSKTSSTMSLSEFRRRIHIGDYNSTDIIAENFGDKEIRHIGEEMRRLVRDDSNMRAQLNNEIRGFIGKYEEGRRTNNATKVLDYAFLLPDFCSHCALTSKGSSANRENLLQFVGKKDLQERLLSAFSVCDSKEQLQIMRDVESAKNYFTKGTRYEMLKDLHAKMEVKNKGAVLVKRALESSVKSPQPQPRSRTPMRGRDDRY